MWTSLVRLKTQFDFTYKTQHQKMNSVTLGFLVLANERNAFYSAKPVFDLIARIAWCNNKVCKTGQKHNPRRTVSNFPPLSYLTGHRQAANMVSNVITTGHRSQLALEPTTHTVSCHIHCHTCLWSSTSLPSPISFLEVSLQYVCLEVGCLHL